MARLGYPAARGKRQRKVKKTLDFRPRRDTVPSMNTPSQVALVKALKVILFTEGTARYLLEHDPKAFEQAEEALNAIGENRSGVYPRNAARLHLSSGNEYAD